MKGMLEILNSIFDPGTEVHLLNRCPLEERVERLAEMGLDCDRDLANLEVGGEYFNARIVFGHVLVAHAMRHDVLRAASRLCLSKRTS